MPPEVHDEPPVVRVEGLRKAFRGHLGIGRTRAVDDLTLEVCAGEIFGLLGPNGAGKTTTLKMMVGLLRPDGGEVRIFGLPPSRPEARLRLGFLPENPYFYDYLSAEEFLDYYARLKGIRGRERRERVSRALERVGLDGSRHGALRKLSKGTLQRVGLAQAIVGDPDLLILDEPMSGLDPLGRRQVRDLILSLRDAGRTVLFSSHILQDAELVCDRVAILSRGRLRSVGRLETLVSRQVRWFEVSVRGPVPECDEGEPIVSGGDEVLLRVDDVDELSRLMSAVRQAGGQVVSVWPRRETLEDIFLREVAEGSTAHGRGA